jgi:hypothetical protein
MLVVKQLPSADQGVPISGLNSFKQMKKRNVKT